MTEAVTPQELEQTLRDLDRIATPLRRGPVRELWRFPVGSRSYLLHFYPAVGRFSRGAGPKQFAGLKTLQKKGVPALHVVALLSGLRFGDRIGDGVLTDDPAGVFADHLSGAERARARPHLLDTLAALAGAGLGHAVLRPESFVVAGDRVLIADAAALTNDRLDRDQLLQFAHAAGEWASRSDRLYAWRRLMDDPEATPPPDRRPALRFAADLKRDPTPPVVIGDWRGRFRPGDGRTPEWSTVAGLPINAADWVREWPRLVDAIRNGQLGTLKSDVSGDILTAQLYLAGRPVEVVLKRPRNKFWYRYVLDAFRPSRAWRMWQKSRWLVARGLPVELPLAVFERRRSGYTVEAVAIFEKVPGPTLEQIDLNALSPAARDTLFRRCGRVLRRIEDTGLAHTDAKSSNWIVYDSPTQGPTPVMLDAYGIRGLIRGLQLAGLHRLLRAMKKHPQYTPADSLALCQGFAPRVTPEADDAG